MSVLAPIGLTGGVACGKSTLARDLGRRGWHVIDTDHIAHALMVPGQATYKNVVDAFGPSVLQPDLSIDRKVLGRLVFADPRLRAKLNEITHPAIRSAWQRELEERTRTHPSQSLAVMIPLLFECKLETLFGSVWVVGASRATQLRRLGLRGFSSDEAIRRIDSQLPIASKMTWAHRAFWGEGSPSTLRCQLDEVLN